MPIRIQQYATPPRRVQVGGIDPGFQQALVRHVGQDAAASTTQALLDAGKQLTEVGIKEYVSQETARVSQALQDYKTQLSAEQERYTSTNQGQNALDAAQHFDGFAREAAAPLAEKFSGKFRTMFMQDAAAFGLRFTEQGQAYASQQEKAWKKSQWDGDVAQTMDSIAQDPGNKDFIETALGNLKGRYAEMFPGMDYRAVDAEINHKASGIIIDSFLAKEDVGRARGAFEQYKGILGAAAPQYEARIRSMGRELQARARAEAERAEADANKRALDSFLTDTAGMSSEEQLATAKSRFGDNQKMYVAALDAVTFRDGASKAIRGKEQEIRLNAQADKIAEVAALSPQESLAKFNELSAALPVEDRKKAYEMYDNAVKATGPDARGTDYPGAKEEVLSRMATGEEFNVWTEYGGLLSPRTLKELSDKHVRDALPGIKNDFKLRAMEFLGEEKNKDLAETALGGKSINALFAVYYDRLSQEDRRNPVAMREKTDRFFKSTLLDSGRWYMSDKSVPMGLQPRYLEKKPGWFPKKGQPEYDAITTWLKGEGIKPEGAAGKYTDEQRAQAYKIMLEAQR